MGVSAKEVSVWIFTLVVLAGSLLGCIAYAYLGDHRGRPSNVLVNYFINTWATITLCHVTIQSLFIQQARKPENCAKVKHLYRTEITKTNIINALALQQPVDQRACGQLTLQLSCRRLLADYDLLGHVWQGGPPHLVSGDGSNVHAQCLALSNPSTSEEDQKARLNDGALPTAIPRPRCIRGSGYI